MKVIFKFVNEIHFLAKNILKAGIAVYCGLSGAALAIMLFPHMAGEAGRLYWSEQIMSLGTRTVLLCFIMAAVADLILRRGEKNEK